MIDVTLFDPELKFKRDLKPEIDRNIAITRRPQGIRVYQVDYCGELFVLKIAQSNSVRENDITELFRESAVLKRASDIQNISRLVNVYTNVPGLHAELKEYANAISLDRVKHQYEKESVMKTLMRTVGSLHERGITNLNIAKEGIVLFPEGYDYPARLVYFEKAIFAEELKSDEHFNLMKKRDYLDLEIALL